MLWLVFVGCGGEPAPRTVSIAPVATSQAPVATSSPLNRTVYRLDKHVTLADCEWWIMEARDAGQRIRSNDPNNDEDKSTTGRFIQVHFTLTNLSQKDEMMVEHAMVQDDKGRQFSAVEMEGFYVPARTKSLGLEMLHPNQPQEYWTVFEVPADAERLRLKVHGFARGKSAFVDLRL